MSSLRDQMLKAGLVSKKDAKRAAHTQRVETKEVGRDALEQKAEAERAAIAQEAGRQRELDRQAAAQRKAEQDARERALGERAHVAAQIESALRDGKVEHWEGNRNYFFTVNGTEIVFLTVNDDAVRRLSEGKAAIIRTSDPRAPYTLLLAGAAQRLAEAAPERIVLLHPDTPAHS